MTASKKKPVTGPSDRGFRDKAVARAWIELFKGHRFGDLYRLWLINPAVVQMALAANGRKKGMSGDIRSLDLGLAIQGQHFKGGDDWHKLPKLEEWQADQVQQGSYWKPIDGLRVLDLGCGVGYRAGILTPMGATYYGVDYNADFIKFAQRQQKSTGAKFTQLDLDSLKDVSPVEAAEILKRCCDGEPPDLVLCINVIEHLEYPDSLLAATKVLLGDSYRSAMLFAMTNHQRYYQTYGTESPYEQKPETVPIICLTGQRVPIHQRPRTHLASLLRDAGFVVAQEAFLSLPLGADAEVQRVYEAKPEDVNWGVAPFIASAATPLPTEQQPSEDIRQRIKDHAVIKLLTNGSKQEAALISTICEQGRVICLHKGERLLARHNMGGGLFVVLKGHLFVPHEPETVFREGDLFGELEANHSQDLKNPRFGFYIHDVIAGDDDTGVFIIPESITSKLLDPKHKFNAALFARLRHRLLLRNDRQTKRSFREKPFNSSKADIFIGWHLCREKNETSDRHAEDLKIRMDCPEKARPYFFLQNTKIPFKSVDKYSLGRLAGALLHLCEIERDKFQRCQWANCLLADFDALSEIAEIPKTSGEVSASVRFLHRLGVLDAIPVRYLKEVKLEVDSTSTTLLKETQYTILSAVSRWAQQDLDAITPAPSAEKITQAKNLCAEWFRLDNDKGLWLSFPSRHTASPFSGHQSSCAGGQASLQGSTENLMTAKFRKFRDCIKSSFGSDDAIKQSLQRSLTMLARVNFLLSADSAHFFVVHDLPLLRSLAYDSEHDLEQLLFGRSLIHYTGTSGTLTDLKSLVSNLNTHKLHGRLRLYAAALCQFITNDIKRRDGTLSYSTNNDNEAISSPPALA